MENVQPEDFWHNSLVVSSLKFIPQNVHGKSYMLSLAHTLAHNYQSFPDLKKQVLSAKSEQK